MRLQHLVLATPLLAATTAAQSTVLISQQPDHVTQVGAFSDATMMSWGSQLVGDDFLVSDPAGVLVQDMTFWGSLYKDVYAGPDHFNIEFYDKGADGLPATLLHAELDVQPAKVLTGWVTPSFSAMKEIEYTYAFPTPVALSPGEYWVVIYNDTPTQDDTWNYFTALIDPINGLPNHTFQSNSGTWWDGNLPTSGVPKEFAFELRGASSGNLTSDVGDVSMFNGGAVNFSLVAGAAHAGETYLLLGSAIGTSPGLPLAGGVTLPLNFDAYTSLTLSAANTANFVSTFGVLDGAGEASAALVVPPGTNPALAGATVHHAYLTFDPSFTAVFASDPLALLLAP